MENRAISRKASHLNYPDDVPWVITSQTNDETKIRLGLQSKDEFQSWLTHYQDKSGYVYRVLRHRKSDGKYAVFKATYRCQHNTVPSHHRAKKPSTKHTNCPAKIEVTIKAVHKRSRGLDEYMPTYPAIVRLIANHNHRSNALESLKHRDVPESIRSKFLGLFKAGHGPAQALKLHKKDLMLEYGDSYNELLSDRAVCPDSKWVYYIYNRDFKRFHSQTSTNERIIEELEQEVKNLQSRGIRVVMEYTKEQFHYLAMCTPFMDRVHHLETSGIVTLIDSGGNTDRHNYYVFLIMVDSCLGGLPVGALILSSLNEKLFTAALKSYYTLMPNSAFGGKGEWGPSIFLCDDIKLQESAIKECFPNSVIMFCPSIVLQQIWRWLWDPKHNIEPVERKELYLRCTYLFSCSTDEEFQSYYDSTIVSIQVQKYPKFVKFLSELRIKEEIWSLSTTTNRFVLEDSNNLNEIIIRILKDKILDKTQSFSLLQMLQFLVNNLTKYYKKKITCSVRSNLDTYFFNQYSIHREVLNQFDVTRENDYLSFVKRIDNPEENFHVSLICGTCECSVGKTINMCSHQQIVAASDDIAATKAVPVDVDSKRHLIWLASGQCPLDPLMAHEADDESSLEDETTVEMEISPQIVVDEEKDHEELMKTYSKNEIEHIGLEFIETVLKFYEESPKKLVIAMRKFQTCFQQKCKNKCDTINFLNSLSNTNDDATEENVNKMVAAEHDYSYQID